MDPIHALVWSLKIKPGAPKCVCVCSVAEYSSAVVMELKWPNRRTQSCVSLSHLLESGSHYQLLHPSAHVLLPQACAFLFSLRLH